MQIVADRDICIGAGMCVITAPAVFDQDDNGIVVPRASAAVDATADDARRAAALCPSGALRIIDETPQGDDPQ